MRVTAAQVYRSQLLRLRKRSSESARAQEVATSGRRLVRPSDDPVGAARSLRVRDMLGDVETARGKIASVHRELTHEETAIAGMTDVLSRVKELAVQMASPVADAGSRAAAASEVDGLRSQLIALANTDVAGAGSSAAARSAPTPSTQLAITSVTPPPSRWRSTTRPRFR